MIFKQYKDLSKPEVRNEKFAICLTTGASQNSDVLRSNVV